MDSIDFGITYIQISCSSAWRKFELEESKIANEADSPNL